MQPSKKSTTNKEFEEAIFIEPFWNPQAAEHIFNSIIKIED